MATFELKMPKLGESITEATITKWLKGAGDRIELDDPVLELATDKVDSEIPSPVEGILKKQLFNEGDTVDVDTVIALIEMDNGDEVTEEIPDEEASSQTAGVDKDSASEASSGEAIQPGPATSDQTASDKGQRSDSGRFYSPLVRNIAQKEGVSAEELEAIPGSGKNNRLTKDDLLSYISERKKRPADKPGEVTPAESGRVPAASRSAAPAIPVGNKDEVIEMDRMRKLIADHMVLSEDTSVHITLFREVDMQRIVQWREKQKGILLEREGEKLTYTPVFIEAIARALRDYPMMNVSLDGHKIIRRGNINVGMAVALPDGNLIVPVIKNADHKNLLGLTKEVNDLAGRARNNKLKPDEIQGGTFTLTNFGTVGATMGTPIINQPQVGILGLGLIQKKPVVIETADGDHIAIRHRMDLSLACDHRIVDGALGGLFMQRVAEYLENFDATQRI